VDLSLADVTAVMDVARRVDPNPLALGGRLLGFSSEEQESGVPTWAWVVLGLAAGAGVGLVVVPKVRGYLDNSAPWLSQGGKGPSKSRKVFGRWSSRKR
jgi:hypothetical protein